MRYQPIDPNLFIQHRKKLVKQLLPNSLALFHANDVLPTNTDGVMPFVQNSDLFYLSGIDQEETILVLYPDAVQETWKEMLFVRQTNETIAIWEGQKHTKETAASLSGISTVYWTNQFESILHTLMGLVDHVYLNTNEHARAVCLVETRDRRFIDWAQARYPLHRYERIAPIMQQLRGIKDEAEISLLQQACAITEAGFRSILPIVRPGRWEYEIEAQLAYEFIRRGSSGFAYAPIVASGADSCILHYTKNDKPCPSEGLLLLDVGAAYANYASDLTRVVPIQGRFTPRQREVYQSVLRILQTAQGILSPGLSFAAYHQVVAETVEQELIGLKLLDAVDIKNQSKTMPAYKKYFMHGISHHLGLSTHDLGDTYGKILPNMVLTVEPGIYIPQEGIGIRLENNVVVRHNGVQNLMENIPIEAEEIEELMHR